jgi:hypothetical protein
MPIVKVMVPNCDNVNAKRFEDIKENVRLSTDIVADPRAYTPARNKVLSLEL